MTAPTLIPKYKALFDAPKNVRYFIITGGRGSSKSFHVSDAVLKYTYSAGEKILYSRRTMTSAHISIIPEFTEKIDMYEVNESLYVTKAEIINLRTNSSILFRGIQASSGNQTAKLKSLQGVTCWVLDEAEEQQDEDEFETIDFSFRKKGKNTRIILMLNPTTKEHWIYKRFFESKGVQEGFNGIVGDTCYIHTTYLDNANNLESSFLNRVNEMRVSNPEKYNHIMLGGWLQKAEGVIYKNWRYGEFDTTLPYYFGSDYGFNPDPDVLVKVAIDHKQKYIYVKECFCYTQMKPTDLVKDIVAYVGKDTLHSESADQRITAMLKAERVNVIPTQKYPNSVEDGIRMVQDFTIIVSPESVKIAKELNNYVEKNGKPLSNGYDHFLDAIRYVIMGVITKKPKQYTKASL